MCSVKSAWWVTECLVQVMIKFGLAMAVLLLKEA